MHETIFETNLEIRKLPTPYLQPVADILRGEAEDESPVDSG